MKNDLEHFESKLVKARKLAALADAGNGGSPGEVENARRMLREHCERWGITAEALDQSRRTGREMLCVSLSKRHHGQPWQGMELGILAVGCLKLVLNEPAPDFGMTEMRLRVKGSKRKRKPFKAFAVQTSLTDLEFEDWRECFNHYAPHLQDSLMELRRRAALARKAQKLGIQAFLNKHDIFSAQEVAGEGGSCPDLQALLHAMTAVQGDAWEKKAGYLQRGGFFLEG